MDRTDNTFADVAKPYCISHISLKLAIRIDLTMNIKENCQLSGRSRSFNVSVITLPTQYDNNVRPRSLLT